MKKCDFTVGDYVFYPTAGVGVLEAVEALFFGGERQEYYIIRVSDNAVTIKVPKQNAERNGLRPLLPSRRLKELFRVLGEKESERPSGHWADHYKELERRIQSGCCLQIGAVVRDLLRLKAGNGLSFEETRLLATATGYLTHEVAAIEGIGLDAAAARIRETVSGTVA